MSLLISNNQEILKDTNIKSKIEFIGIINEKGRLVESTDETMFCDMPNDRREMFFMKIALRNSMQKDFDEYLEPVNYCMTQRGSKKFISVPRDDGTTILLVVKRKVNVEEILQEFDWFSSYRSSENMDGGRLP